MTTLQIGGAAVTSTVAELNILDGVTATAAEINLLDGSTAGSAVAGTALVVDASRNIGNINQLTASYARIEELDVITINSVAQTNQTLEIVDKLIIAASGAASANAADGGLQIGGTNGSDTVASVLYDHANLALDFNIAGTTEIRLQDGVLRPETDNDVDLGASGAEFKDLYIDGVAYLDSIDLNGTAITSTAAEINLLDAAAAGTVVNSKAVIYGSAGEVNATSLEVGGVAITATPAEINLLDAGGGTAVALQGSDGFIMFDDSASNVAKKVLVSDMADFVGENLAEKITRVAAGATHNHAFATHGSILSVDGSGAAVTINLPAISSANDGKVLKIKKYNGSADITINRSGAGQDIDGLASIKLESDHAAISLIFDYNGGTDPRYFVL